MDKDIFEDMFHWIHSEYLSDLQFKKKEVFQKLKTIDYTKYSSSNLKDFFEYIFQKEIQNIEDIKNFLNQEIMEEIKWEKETLQLSLD